MSLIALQHAFQEYVLRGVHDIVDRIEPGRLANRERRLAVYYDAYRLRLVEALGTDFDALAAVMGKEGFEDACWSYVEATPSPFRNVRWYGGDLPAFLRKTPPWNAQPWLADIAQFEWTLTLAFDAADARHVCFEDLAVLPVDAWGTLGFRLHPSARMIELRANAPAIRKAVDVGTRAPAPELGDKAVTWLIWRKDLSPRFRSLSEPEAWALRSAGESLGFPEICQGLCLWLSSEEAARTAAGWLRTWVDDQLIVELLKV